MSDVRGVVVGKYVVANCTTPVELAERAAETARRMAREITLSPSS